MATMVILYFTAGALFSVAQYLLSKRMFDIAAAPKRSALYVGQLLILSLALLTAMFFVSETALIASAVGLVITSTVCAAVNSLKR